MKVPLFFEAAEGHPGFPLELRAVINSGCEVACRHDEAQQGHARVLTRAILVSSFI
jgi:hypothetical protein